MITFLIYSIFPITALRGGISQCSKRYQRANNKYMVNYDPTQPSNYLMYLDVNNLYGWAMMEHLPLSCFKWSHESINNILNTKDDSEIGYILEVNLEYPEELHDKHNDYPMCPEHLKINGSKINKLILNLNDKNHYVLHYRTLKLVLKYGLKLTGVGKILEFRQTQWLKPYIELNTYHRKQATNEFEKNFFKLMSNSIYGKTMENVRNRVNIILCNKWEGRYGAKSKISKPNFKKSTILDKNLVSIEMYRTKIVFDKPIVIGVSILEISKLCMYEFHYGFMKTIYQNNINLLYTDTDSFIYNISCDNFYNEMKKHSDKFDTSDYKNDNQFEIIRLNKKIPGLMKDENNGEIMTEFVGLRSKMYSIKINNKDGIRKSKGVKKNVINTKLSFESYLNCILHHCNLTEKQHTILSKKHRVYSIEQMKNVLDPFDDKRYILDNFIDTLAWGHYKIKVND